MVSPERVDEQKPEAKHVLSPVEEKQVLPVSEKKRPWIELLLRVVAVVLSLIGGVAYYYLLVLGRLPMIETPPPDGRAFLGVVAFLLVFLVGVGGAVLFRSWWAILLVPLALGLGAYIASYQIPKLIPLNAYDSEVVYTGAAITSLIILPIIAVIGASIGSAIGMAWKKRRPL